jgi:SAM-dependent methyltransferase
VEFARRGCVVTGLDLSEPMLVEARRKAKEAGLAVSLFQSDMRDFSLPAEFDCAACLYDSFNYVLESEELKQAFANTRRALKPTGAFLFDVNTVHALEAELFTQTSPTDTAVRYRWRSKYDPETRISTIHMHFEIRATEEEFDTVHRQRAYTDAELRSLLVHGGFGDIYAYDGYRLSPPTPTSDRVFYVALPRPV